MQVSTVQRKFPEQDVRLLEAARAGNTSRVAELLEAGTDINTADANEHTALIFASMGGHLSMVRMLMEAGADASHRDALGYDAYTAAMIYGDFRGMTMAPFDQIMTAVKPTA